MVPRLRALIWDVDGTLAETERDGHRVAFNQAFEALGLPWRWDVTRYGQLLETTGGYERLLIDMQTQPLAPLAQDDCVRLARSLHGLKNEAYAALVRDGRIPLRPGVRALMDDCVREALPMAIATTTSRANVDALLGVHLGSAWQQYFQAVLCGEDAPNKKPDPEVYYVRTLRQLGLAADQVLAIEDSPPGVAACEAAGVPVVVTRSVYFEHAMRQVPQALAVGPGLHTRSGWSTRFAAAEGDQPATQVASAANDAAVAGTDRISLAWLRRWYGRNAVDGASSGPP